MNMLAQQCPLARSRAANHLRLTVDLDFSAVERLSELDAETFLRRRFRQCSQGTSLMQEKRNLLLRRYPLPAMRVRYPLFVS